MRIIVMGHKDHGKDTVCEILRDRFGLGFISSSDMANKLFMFDLLKDEMGYASMEECFADRVNHRERWYNEICDFNKDDRARLGKKIFSTVPVYCGLRDLDEFLEIRSTGGVDLVVWVDASNRKPMESAKSITVTRDLAHVYLDNNGPESALAGLVANMYDAHIKPMRALHNARLSPQSAPELSF